MRILWQEYTKLKKIPLNWRSIFHAKYADRVIACGFYTRSYPYYVMEVSNTRSINSEVYIALKCKRAEREPPSDQKSLDSD